MTSKFIGCNKVGVREKFIAVKCLDWKRRRYQIKNLNKLMTLDKEDKIKSKANRKKERIKIRAKLNEIENRKTIE